LDTISYSDRHILDEEAYWIVGSHRFGYVAANTTLRLSTNQTCSLPNVSKEYLAGRIEVSITNLKEIIDWNARHQIQLFQIGSGIIPFRFHGIHQLLWPIVFRSQLAEIGECAENQGVRLIMRPRISFLMTSTTQSVFQVGLNDLKYHAAFLGSMGLNTACKIIVQLGGSLHDKENQLNRFIQTFQILPDALKRRLAIVNDKNFLTIQDALKIHQILGIPVVFDDQAHELNKDPIELDTSFHQVLESCAATWQVERDGPPIVYLGLSQTDEHFSHSGCRTLETFLNFFEQTQHLDYDLIIQGRGREQTVMQILAAIHLSGIS
jgi:UV DNA damage endonuclease